MFVHRLNFYSGLLLFVALVSYFLFNYETVVVWTCCYYIFVIRCVEKLIYVYISEIYHRIPISMSFILKLKKKKSYFVFVVYIYMIAFIHFVLWSILKHKNMKVYRDNIYN